MGPSSIPSKQPISGVALTKNSLTPLCTRVISPNVAIPAASNSGNPLLCFVDEVLRGTNTVERIAASAQILRSLSQSGIYCFAATHDIELTHLLEDCYDNSHFEEDIEGGDVSFSYRLLEGRAHTRNAIKLLEIIGFSDDIIKEADNMAGEFLRSGVWKRG